MQGRELVAFRADPLNARRRVLVVGVIHVNETAGREIAQDLLRTAAPAPTEFVVVPDLNPDGAAHGTRQNAAAVDLNRNFPYRWKGFGRRGDQQYSGPGPLSEPESRAMAELIRRLRPTVSVWFHQPVGVVDESVAVDARSSIRAGPARGSRPVTGRGVDEVVHSEDQHRCVSFEVFGEQHVGALRFIATPVSKRCTANTTSARSR